MKFKPIRKLDFQYTVTTNPSAYFAGRDVVSWSETRRKIESNMLFKVGADYELNERQLNKLHDLIDDTIKDLKLEIEDNIFKTKFVTLLMTKYGLVYLTLKLIY